MVWQVYSYPKKLDKLLGPRRLGYIKLVKRIDKLVHDQILEDLGNNGCHVGDRCWITGIVLSGVLL